MPNDQIDLLNPIIKNRLETYELTVDQSCTSLQEVDCEDLETFREGNLSLIGQIWVELFKPGLFSNWSLIPTVSAAKEQPPERPPKMKYRDLPLYKSPHYDYKSYLLDVEDQKCPGKKTRILHSYLLPIVKSNRKYMAAKSCEIYRDYLDLQNQFVGSIRKKKNDFIKEMRDPKNLRLRQAIWFVSGATGCYYGCGKSYLRTFFFSGIGFLAAGALCFPKDNDYVFRTVTFHTAEFLIGIYNIYCNKNFGLKQRIPCKEDMPKPEPPRRKQNVCKDKKK